MDHKTLQAAWEVWNASAKRERDANDLLAATLAFAATYLEIDFRKYSDAGRHYDDALSLVAAELPLIVRQHRPERGRGFASWVHLCVSRKVSTYWRNWHALQNSATRNGVPLPDCDLPALSSAERDAITRDADESAERYADLAADAERIARAVFSPLELAVFLEIKRGGFRKTKIQSRLARTCCDFQKQIAQRLNVSTKAVDNSLCRIRRTVARVKREGLPAVVASKQRNKKRVLREVGE